MGPSESCVTAARSGARGHTESARDLLPLSEATSVLSLGWPVVVVVVGGRLCALPAEGLHPVLLPGELHEQMAPGSCRLVEGLIQIWEDRLWPTENLHWAPAGCGLRFQTLSSLPT